MKLSVSRIGERTFMGEVVYANDLIEISRNGTEFSVRSLKPGMSMQQFDQLLSERFPQIAVTAFQSVRRVLASPPAGPEVFGSLRERVCIRVSEDGLKAWMTLHVEPENLNPQNRINLVKEIGMALKHAEVSYGIHKEVLGSSTLKNATEYLIAEGDPPQNGEDATILMIDLTPPVPEVIEEGAANHYELNLIRQVVEGDWLGERTDPTPGVPGTDVAGRAVPPTQGISYPLRYERSSVKEDMEPGKTVLRARKAGAVFYRGDMVGVYNYLEVSGNIDFSTGNVDFDGFLSVKGTVDDNFSVKADRDIEILGEYGVGGADEIVSRDGSIYIRGGIAGKGRAVIRCRKNLYVKYLSDVTVVCEGNVYIGFYAINSSIRARQIFVDSPRGRIVGGSIEADIRIEVAELGNRSESKTRVRINGFDRVAFRNHFEQSLKSMETGKMDMGRLKQKIRLFDSSTQTPEQKEEQADLRQKIEDLKDHLKEVEYEYKSLADHLRTPGEGAVIVKKKCYALVHLEIKDKVEDVKMEQGLCTFVYRDGELRVE